MNEDRLEQLLREADARAGTPATPNDLAARVRLRAARRRGRMAGGLSAAAAVILAGLSLWQWHRMDSRPDAGNPEAIVANEGNTQKTPGLGSTDGSIPAPVVAKSAAEVLAELDRLNREAAFETALVSALSRTNDTEKQIKDFKVELVALPDAVANARRDADEAAYAMVAHADRMCRELHSCVSAAERYRWVAEYFPESCWATVARQRLNELKEKGEIS
jgi:hypothetical protein